MINVQEAKNDSRIEPSYLMTKESSIKYIIKITEKWLEKSSKTSKVNESDLQIIIMLACDYESIMSCYSYLKFRFKCLQIIQEDNDACFDGFLVLPRTEKVK